MPKAAKVQCSDIHSPEAFPSFELDQEVSDQHMDSVVGEYKQARGTTRDTGSRKSGKRGPEREVKRGKPLMLSAMRFMKKETVQGKAVGRGCNSSMRSLSFPRVS